MFAGATTTDFPTEPIDLTAAEDLVDALAAILVRRDRDEARAAKVLAQIAETRAFERDGYSSPTAMLKHRMSLHPGEAQRLMRRANALPGMALTALAYDRGRSGRSADRGSSDRSRTVRHGRRRSGATGDGHSTGH